MRLGTADAPRRGRIGNSDGRPSARQVLLKGFDAHGFRFFTNYDSRKGRDIAANPQVALCFWWAALDRQVRVEGVASRVSRPESEAYFRSRPREHQLGALASHQSAPIDSRAVLEAEYRRLSELYPTADGIPMPANWGGFLVHPTTIEFWQGRASRLHDRLLYTRDRDTWRLVRLSP